MPHFLLYLLFPFSVATAIADAFQKINILREIEIGKSMKIFVKLEHLKNKGVTFSSLFLHSYCSFSPSFSLMIIEYQLCFISLCNNLMLGKRWFLLVINCKYQILNLCFNNYCNSCSLSPLSPWFFICSHFSISVGSPFLISITNLTYKCPLYEFW